MHPRHSVAARRLAHGFASRQVGSSIAPHRRRACLQSSVYYSSLRNPRQPGPRSRILSHVDQLRVKAAPSVARRPNITVQEDQQFSPNPAQVPVEIPEAKEGAVVTPDYHGTPVLAQPALVVGRELEMMNIFLGYEQANRYKIMDPQGNYVGYIAEEEGFMKSLSRQFLRTHRPMNATVLNAQGEVVFKIVRPFAFINSRIFIYTSDDRLIGEVQQRWHPFRRKYDLFVGKTQFAYIDTPFLGWDFALKDENGGILGDVNRNFTGFAREIFTDTGEYVLRMDAVEGNSRGMTLDERAVTLACAVSIDFDYFSRHSQHGGGGILPIPFFGFGSGEESREPDAGAGVPEGGPNAGRVEQQQQQPEQRPMDQPRQNEYGDVWLDDEEAGVSSPEDDLSGFWDAWGEEEEDEESW